MEIPEKLLKLKFHLIFATLFSILLISLILLAPRFLTLISYFWPLFLSTALFLIAVVIFGRFSPPTSEISPEKAGEEILDYVAGQPEEQQLVIEEVFEEHKVSEKSE